MDDTSPAARKRYFQLLARRTPAQKLAICSRLMRASRAMALAGIREQHPYATDTELARLLAVRIYGDAVPHRLRPR